MPKKPTKAFDYFSELHCSTYKIPQPQREFQFHPERKWRADYAWPDLRIMVEIDGGAWINGRHTRGAGFVADMEKYNAAATMGYRLFRYRPKHVDYTGLSEVIRLAVSVRNALLNNILKKGAA